MCLICVQIPRGRLWDIGGYGLRHLLLIIPFSDWTDGCPGSPEERGVPRRPANIYCEWSPARSFSRLPSP